MNRWICIFGSDEIHIPKEIESSHLIADKDLRIYFSDEDRFQSDTLFRKNDQFIDLVDGVVLNYSELREKYSSDSNDRVVDSLIREYGDTFFKEFRGPFSGIHYDRCTGKLLIYGNQTGDAPVFYAVMLDTILASNDLNLIVNTFNENRVKYSFDEVAAKYAMSFGYMIDDRTFIQEISRVTPSHYLLMSDDGISICKYHQFHFEDTDIDFDEAVERVDREFRKAVKRCFDKDLEYGVQYHLVDISGGLDSRMVNWVAKDLGYTNIYNISYSQSGSDELRFASITARELKNLFIHMQLDDTSFLYDIDQIIGLNYGLAFYSGITGGRRLLELCNKELFGLEHTGQLGDVIIGSFSDADCYSKPDPKIRRFSHVIDYQPPESLTQQYETNEEFAFFNRGFRGILSTHLTRRHYFYTVSPFIDIDFMNACFSIPMRYRQHHKLYWAWIDGKYPEAGKIPSTRMRNFTHARLKNRVKRGFRIVKQFGKRLGLVNSISDVNEMNPYDYWYETNAELRSFVNNYFHANIALAKHYCEVQKDIEKLFTEGNARDKLIALTVLGVLKKYFPLSE